MKKKLLLCTDMDRTIIPNGSQSEDTRARNIFFEFCNFSDITLVYVTGRHKKLVQQAIKNYNLPTPEYAITDVGTVIYHIQDNKWLEFDEWYREIDKDWNGKNHDDIKKLFYAFPELKLQEFDKQNTHKLSYYVSLHANYKKLIDNMSCILEKNGINASLIWSIDEPKGIGLLDILPQNATKLHAINFLKTHLGYSQDEVLFAGDSGNDLPVFASGIPSVLVANASPEIRETSHELANNHRHSLYMANGSNTSMNGNYAAGVLEGVYHYMPYFRERLVQLGFANE